MAVILLHCRPILTMWERVRAQLDAPPRDRRIDSTTRRRCYTRHEIEYRERGKHSEQEVVSPFTLPHSFFFPSKCHNALKVQDLRRTRGMPELRSHTCRACLRICLAQAVRGEIVCTICTVRYDVMCRLRGSPEVLRGGHRSDPGAPFLWCEGVSLCCK